METTKYFNPVSVTVLLLLAAVCGGLFFLKIIENKAIFQNAFL